MLQGSRSDEKRAVSSKLSRLLVIAMAIFAVSSTGALAAGVQRKRVAAAPPANPIARSSTSLIAPPAACPNQTDPTTPPDVQEQAMRCMTEFARTQVGLNELSDSPQLDLSAREKGADVLRCDSFSHFACDREFTYWMREVGYISKSCWHTGENLAWGTGSYGTVRSIFQAWMRSPGHRHNILGDYEDLGLSRQAGELDGRDGADVWTAHFGSHCGASAAIES
jgi:uncharacterized protein YkwD